MVTFIMVSTLIICFCLFATFEKSAARCRTNAQEYIFNILMEIIIIIVLFAKNKYYDSNFFYLQYNIYNLYKVGNCIHKHFYS